MRSLGNGHEVNDCPLWQINRFIDGIVSRGITVVCFLVEA
jgi:hypothetical protein